MHFEYDLGYEYAGLDWAVAGIARTPSLKSSYLYGGVASCVLPCSLFTNHDSCRRVQVAGDVGK